LHLSQQIRQVSSWRLLQTILSLGLKHVLHLDNAVLLQVVGECRSVVVPSGSLVERLLSYGLDAARTFALEMNKICKQLGFVVHD
jgi:hypothetical protein